MNYRISHVNEQVRKALDELSIVPLYEKDQLRCEMKSKRVFKNYSEPDINFLPTYKFDPNTDTYDSSEKNRTPSWTDRILYHTKIHHQNQIEPLCYNCARTIRFSDHRPVSGFYLISIKYQCDEKRLNALKEKLIRDLDREDNDSIPTIKVEPRVPAIVFHNIRYLDQMNYTLTIKNIGECSCTCTICPSAMFKPNQPINVKQLVDEPFFDCLNFTPNSPYFLETNDEQSIDISFQMKSRYAWLFGKQINEILILHVENGADTFITLDITLDMGPFGLSLSQLPSPLYNTESKQYIYSSETSPPSSHGNCIEMKNDPPALYILLIDTLKIRDDLNVLNIFNNDIQDTIDLIPIRDQIYEHNYNFQQCKTIDLFMILLHLFRSLPEPLISRDIQNRIFLSSNSISSNRSYHLPSGTSIQSHIPNDLNPSNEMSKAVSIIIELLKAKDRNLFFRFLLLLQKSWPTNEQMKKIDYNQRHTLNAAIDVLSFALLHDHASQKHRHEFLLACLNEEKKKSSK